MRRMTPPEKALERLRKLESVTEAALSSLEIDKLLDELLVRVREILAADTCAVLLLEGDELVARAAKGIEEEVERGVRIPLGRGFAGRVADERRPVVIEDVDKADIYNPLLREKGIRSLLGAPLLGHGGVLGVIHVGTLRPRRFDEDDVELIQLAADRVARGLERALVHDHLVRLDRLKETFVALASHELRAPATAVVGAAATLHRRFDELPEFRIRELVQMLYEQSEHLATLTNQLLDLSRLETETFELDLARLNVRDRLDELVTAVAPDAAARMEIAVPGDLEVLADGQAFDHIVRNLIVNALRHGAPPVTIRAEQMDHQLGLTVEDRGDGVPPQFVPQLFERFRRGEAARTRGSGLGLAIAKSYAQAHGGDVVYEDGEPRGARFRVILPNPR